MARQRRQTEPLETLQGLLARYEDIEPLLSAGEARGRVWVLQRAHSAPQPFWTPSDFDILALHRVMFEEVFDWAGMTRTEDRGPGGRVPVSWPNVRVELRNLVDDLRTWVDTAITVGEPDVATVARIVADAHHRFQWIHPFRDTNGRTGRVLDHLVLWATFELVGETFETSPFLEYFPDGDAEDAYYDGLQAADHHDPNPLRQYYEDRLITALNALTETE